MASSLGFFNLLLSEPSPSRGFWRTQANFAFATDELRDLAAADREQALTLTIRMLDLVEKEYLEVFGQPFDAEKMSPRSSLRGVYLSKYCAALHLLRRYFEALT